MNDPATAPGDVWGFCQTTNDGKGYWYKAGIGRLDDEGRALGKVSLTPFRNFTGDLIICPHDVGPPGATPDPGFPLLRRAGAINDEVDVPLGLMGGFTPIFKTGKGFYQGIGVGWFEPEGRAHGKILLTDGRRIQYVAICPPGVMLPHEALPPVIVPPKPQRPGDDPLEPDGIEGEAELL